MISNASRPHHLGKKLKQMMGYFYATSCIVVQSAVAKDKKAGKSAVTTLIKCIVIHCLILSVAFPLGLPFLIAANSRKALGA